MVPRGRARVCLYANYSTYLVANTNKESLTFNSLDDIAQINNFVINQNLRMNVDKTTSIAFCTKQNKSSQEFIKKSQTNNKYKTSWNHT